MRPDPLDFWNKYELISSSNNYKPINIKSKVCKYCEKSDKETTFKQQTHLLPELIGENNIYTQDECDSCNAIFSDYESSFSIYIRPYITLLGIKGKKKIPAFQSRTIDRNEKTRTTLKHLDNNQKQLHIQSLEDYSINTDDKTFDINFRKSPFTPLKIYKCLLKIGLSLLPNEYYNFNKQSFEWLTNRTDYINCIPYSYNTTLLRKYFSTPFADLYRAKNISDGLIDYPEHLLILAFGNQVMQIFLPFSEELRKSDYNNRQLELNLFPGFMYDDFENLNGSSIHVCDLSSSESITENHKISFSYEEAEINIQHKP